MKDQQQIIPAQPAHYEAIASIYNEYIHAGNATMEETEKSGADIAQWVNNFNDRERLFSLLEKDRVIGWGIIKRYSDREGYRFACETAVYLTADRIGLGFGTFIKKFLIATCKSLHYRHLVAKVFASNQGSIAYNERLGYTIVGRQQQIGYKNDQWVDIVIMQYIIE